jgi:hypothetical protein
MDILKSLLDPFLPTNVVLLNTEFDLNNYKDQKIVPENAQFGCKNVFEKRAWG